MGDNAKGTTWPRALLLAAVVTAAAALGAFAAPEDAAAQLPCDTVFTFEVVNGSWASVERWAPPCDTTLQLTVHILRDCTGHYIPETESPDDHQGACTPTPPAPDRPCYTNWGQPDSCPPGSVGVDLPPADEPPPTDEPPPADEPPPSEPAAPDAGAVALVDVGGDCNQPGDCPDAPTGQATPGPRDGQITVTWAHAGAGGAVTEWILGIRESGSTGDWSELSVSYDVGSHTFTDLDADQFYDVRVQGLSDVFDDTLYGNVGRADGVAARVPPAPEQPEESPDDLSTVLLLSGRTGQGSSPTGDGPSLSCEEQFADLPPGRRALICAAR
ncbi:MAG: fibronectin type III domain-containing protein [Gemmatimonadota bacterium]|nr:fibronectin type III domain-containing protein [Gemmatimonadota bacterium]